MGLAKHALSTSSRFEAIRLILTVPVTHKSATKLTLVQATTVTGLHPVMCRKNPAMWCNLDLTLVRIEL